MDFSILSSCRFSHFSSLCHSWQHVPPSHYYRVCQMHVIKLWLQGKSMDSILTGKNLNSGVPTFSYKPSEVPHLIFWNAALNNQTKTSVKSIWLCTKLTLCSCCAWQTTAWKWELGKPNGWLLRTDKDGDPRNFRKFLSQTNRWTWSKMSRKSVQGSAHNRSFINILCIKK